MRELSVSGSLMVISWLAPINQLMSATAWVPRV